MDSPPQISVLQTAWQWWRYAAAYEGYFPATSRLFGVLWEFARDSTPERLRQRYGDADYDWDYRVNTTSGAVGWRDRLLVRAVVGFEHRAAAVGEAGRVLSQAGDDAVNVGAVLGAGYGDNNPGLPRRK